MSIIAAISGLLSMGGVVSVRMFLPVFIYLLLMKCVELFPDRVTEAMVSMHAQTPEILMHPASVSVIGILAVCECLAMYLPEVKEFLVNSLDSYAKPIISALLALGFLSSDPVAGMEQLTNPEVQKAAFPLTAIWVLLVGGFTHWCCVGRAKLLELMDTIDPDDTLRLKTAENIFEDLLVPTLVLIGIFLPVLAMVITLGAVAVGFLIRKKLERREKKYSHLCPHCLEEHVETRVFGAGFICPVCRKEQDKVFPLRNFGALSAKPLNKSIPAVVARHRMKLRRAKRCPSCASLLVHQGGLSWLRQTGRLDGSSKNRLVPDMICPCCGGKVWDEDSLRAYLRRADGFALLVFGVAFILCVLISFTLFIPMTIIVAATAMIYQPCVILPLNRYASRMHKLWIRFIRNLIKLILLIPLLLLSFLPFVGVLSLVPMVIHYLQVRKNFAKRIRRLIKEYEAFGRAA